jgi:DNA-binding transcriptional ArsR family regulator
MIGVIGSRDSVTLAKTVAEELGLGHQVLGRSYESIDEAAAIARDLDALCRVLLFTGRVPYASAIAQDPPLHATLDFVPHAAIDLYRTLALVMRERGGTVPPFVVDTIDRSIVDEVCQDLGLDPPVAVLDLDAEDGHLRDIDEIVDLHVEAQSHGPALLSLTCLGPVNHRLIERGVPVSRIEHSRSTLNHALTSASLTVRKYEAEISQSAVALLRPAKTKGRGVVVRDLQTYADRLRGVLQATDDGTWCIHTTYGTIESVLVADGPTMPPDWCVGFGIGATPADAELNARRALQLGKGGKESVTVLADGSIVSMATHGLVSYRLRETDDQMLAHARGVGLRSLTLARLAASLRDLDTESVTVRELADAYGVEPRSARRLLARLEEAGIATLRGVEGEPGAGRPRSVYRIDVDALVPSRSSKGA